MKRIVTLTIVAMMMLMTMAPVAFADTFSVEDTSPHDGTTGAAIDNFGLKIYFSENIYLEKNEESNSKTFSLIEIKETENEDGEVTVKDGEKIPVIGVYNPEDPTVLMVLATGSGDKAIKSDTSYRFELSENFKSADGDVLGEDLTVSFRTQNSNTTMITSFVMMAVMIVGMVFFTARSAKKQAEKDGKQKEQTVNPYKEAKATGKSVEEIVAREAKKKAKEQEKKKRQKAENKVELGSGNIRVSRKRPISEVGITYKHPVKKKVEEKKQAQKKSQSSGNKNKKKPQNKKKK